MSANRAAGYESLWVAPAAECEACQEAAAQGIPVVNRWSCQFLPAYKTKHGRSSGSRESHKALDGQVRAAGEAFQTIWGNTLRYPGDPTAPAREVINCHCVLVPEVAGADGESKDKALQNNLSDGTMMLRRYAGIDHDIEAMPVKQLRIIVKAFRRRGGVVQMDEYTDHYLRSCHGEGITYNADTILLHRNPSRVAVFEVLIHTAQYRMGLNNGSAVDIAQNEVWAKEKLLRHAKAYKLTTKEIEATRALLKQDRRSIEIALGEEKR